MDANLSRHDSDSTSDAWLRLKAYLAELRPGDVITTRGTVTQTQLEPESVEVVLSALTRANLFERRGDFFIRLNLL
jgi:hypothetical protein